MLKQILDYYEDIYKEFPTLHKSDIRKILQFGWKAFYMYNNYGGDVLFSYPNFWAYFGSLTKNPMKHFNYYKQKLKIKLRIMYNKKKIPWDGYYYFALSRNLYNDYLKLKNKRGRPRKHFLFSKIVLYKIYDECSIMESNKVALFRIPKLFKTSYSYYLLELNTDKAEFLLERSPLKFKDILLCNYNYQFLTDKTKNRKYIQNGSS